MKADNLKTKASNPAKNLKSKATNSMAKAYMQGGKKPSSGKSR